MYSSALLQSDCTTVNSEWFCWQRTLERRAHAKSNPHAASHHLQQFCLVTDPQDLLRDELVVTAGSYGRGLLWCSPAVHVTSK